MAMSEILREGIMGVVQDEEKTDLIMNICESVARSATALESHVLVEAADGKGNKYETLKDMAVWLLMEADAFNVIHWNTDKLSKHELLGSLYDLCRETGDQLAEAYIAIMDKPIEVGKPTTFPKTSAKDSDVLAHIKELQQRMQEAVQKNPGFSDGVKNYFADFDEKITTIIYKWARFGA
jgi:DNA-binding ferritin-like protein